jgi:hypothetical protein
MVSPDSSEARLVRPALWRRVFKPRYAEMFRKVKQAGRDVWFHSDGFINDIVGDLAEIGIDVLNFQIAVVGHDWTERNIRGRAGIDIRSRSGYNPICNDYK